MEDLEYLMKNSKQGSHLALIDSADRNTALWPTASMFDIVFDTPFQNVYGIDLLSVNIPRTEYNVSSSRNVLAFSFGSGQKHRAVLPEGDYSASTLLAALNLCLQGFVSQQGNVLSVQALSTVTSSLVVVCAEPFTLFLSDSSSRLVLGFANPVNADSLAYSAPGWRPGAADTVTSVVSPVAGATQLTTFQGPNLTSTASAIGVTAQNTVRQSFTSTYGGACVALALPVLARGQPIAGAMSWRVLDLAGNEISAGIIQPDTDSTTPSVGTATTTPAALQAQQQYTLELSHPGNADSSNCYLVFPM